jgi:2-polyprenyl-6-methoxyphenol hydroxylase-like FAD-dependent oxidoreductase
MGGMLAARVLADHYDEVIVVERDELPVEATPRRGVPQGRQGHALHSRGSDAFEQLFPGLLAEFAESGATVLDNRDLSRYQVYLHGHRVKSSTVVRQPFTTYLASRPFVEMHIRRRVFGIPNVKVLDAHDVVEIIASTPARITGVRVANRHSGERDVLEADMVVDALGRAGRTPALLESLGYGRPEEDRLTVNVNYVSQLVRLPAGMVDKGLILIGGVPERPTGGSLMAYEHDTWMVTLAGYAGFEPPADPAGMQHYAAAMGVAELEAAVRDGEPLCEAHQHRFPSSQRRRYEKMRRFPAGLLVLGDAICSFNPVYGQGMTVAALEALTLSACLRLGERDLAERYFRAVSEYVDTAWRMAIDSDLALPQVIGPRPLAFRLSNWLTGQVFATAAMDDVVAEQFLRVVNMVDPPSRLFHPSVLLRVAKRRWHRHGAG